MPADLLLAMIVATVEKEGSRQPVSIWVNGQMFSGDIGPGRDYFRELGSAARKTHEASKGEVVGAQQGHAWNKAGEAFVELAADPDWEPGYLHLFDAVARYYTGLEVHYKVVNVGLNTLRVRMESIDAFSLSRP